MKSVLAVCGAVLCSFSVACGAESAMAPDYAQQVAPLLRKYCAGCHNPTDHDGNFSVDTFADLQKGSEHGPVILAGDVDSSRLIRVLTGAAEPRMPPAGEPAPSADEIALLKLWIETGARGPEGAEPDRMTLLVPRVPSRTDLRPVAAVDISPDGKWLAVARYGEVTLQPSGDVTGEQAAAAPGSRKIGEFPGKVSAVHFSGDGQRLVTASGVTGLGGIAAIWRIDTGELVREFRGHRDLLYDAELSPDGNVLATCSYDRDIILWNAHTGEPLRTLSGHNGAVYDVAFSPDGAFLASASADDTCKVWRVSDGERLDTLGQPLKEQYSITFSPDGRFIAAGGADNRIRIWRFVSTTRPRINPLVLARFAHEGAVLALQYTANGDRLVSVAEDRTLKVWETRDYTELQLQQEPAVAAALAVSKQSPQFVIGRMDGSLAAYRLPQASAAGPSQVATVGPVPIPPDDEPMTMFVEQEPNSDPSTAQRVDVPVQINGVIEGDFEGKPDQDLYRFSAGAGEEWVLEVIAARGKSPLDSFIEVLDGGGRPIERARLQAVRDSYFTFRGKNANEVGDFRLFNWEEMELNEYLYANGEVVKLWMYPRGPDSGFLVYPGAGERWGFFDTTPLSHALGEPCYVVEAHPPGATLIPNGLPEFPLYFENDDDAQRKSGADSKLFFTAPADGEYLVRIRDVRGFQGEEYKYRLLIRPRNPDYRVQVHNVNPKVPAGGSVEFRVTAERLDGFDGPISVELNNLPPGFSASTPIVIEAGQVQAFGVLSCDADAPAPTDQNGGVSLAMASAEIRGEEVTHPGNGLGKITLGEAPKLLVQIEPAPGGAAPLATEPGEPLEFEIHPGETIMLKVRVDRKQTEGEISFGKEDSGRNFPHGVFVDNIGLNGLLLLDGQTEREFFITAAKWVPEQTRLVHLRTEGAGGAASQPILLHVRPKASADR